MLSLVQIPTWAEDLSCHCSSYEWTDSRTIMERGLAAYRQQIEDEVLNIEEQIWTSLYEEQMNLLGVENERLVHLQSAVHQARSTYCEHVLGVRGRTLNVQRHFSQVDNHQQTDVVPEAHLNETDLVALRKEVSFLEFSSGLWAEQKRLQEEPQQGESFIRVRAALQQERELSAQLDAEEADILEASYQQRHREPRARHPPAHAASGETSEPWRSPGLQLQPQQPQAPGPRFTPKRPTAFLQITRQAGQAGPARPAGPAHN